MTTGPTGADVLVSALRERGVDVVFGIPGTHTVEIYRQLTRHGIRHITPRHEQGAGYAADGYARVSGRPGVVLTTSGPGILNAATAAGQSYSDSVPVLLVSSGMPRDHVPGSGLLHETKDQSAAMGAVCAESHRVRTAGEISEAVASAFTRFTTGRPRPVHIEVPYDLLAEASAPGGPLASAERAVPALSPFPSDERVREAARALARARRPVFVVGGGAQSAAEAVRPLAEQVGAWVITTANGKGVLPESHPASLGASLHVEEVREVLAGADLVLAVGTELAEADTWVPSLDLPGTLVRVDIDPAQTLLPRPAEHPLVGDAAEILPALSQALSSQKDLSEKALLPEAPERALAGWPGARAAVHGYAGRWRSVLEALRSVLPADAVLAGDSAQVCYFGALTGFPVEHPRSFLNPTGFGTLGYAVPAAIGAAVAAPERPVAALSGDGGLQFTVGELATAAQHGICLPVVVVNNGGYRMIREEMEHASVPPLGVDLPSPDFAALGTALGGHGVRVAGPAELRGAVADALRRPVPTVIEIPEPPVAP